MSFRQKKIRTLSVARSIAAQRVAFGVMAGFAIASLGGCQQSGSNGNARAYQPIPPATIALMQSKGTDAHAPMLIRAYKKEAELEIWKQKPDGQYALLKTYPMCRWSGQLGPKVREGDRQVPEGFYAITQGQMNPNSNYYLSFNVGYPNAYDRALGHSGGLIMVHGACSSAGCFSMTDEQIAEIYAIARESFGGGQKAIQMQSLPFRMTAENLAKHRLDQNMPFWKQLKEGSDRFEVAKREPAVGVCGKRYVFGEKASLSDRFDIGTDCPRLISDPEVKNLVMEKERRDDLRVAELAEKGVAPVKVVYSDGGQHPSFASAGHDVSRPDALAAAPVEIQIEQKSVKSNVVKLAAAKAPKPAAEAPGQTIAQKSDGSDASASTPVTAMAAQPASEGSAFSRLLSFKSNEAKTETSAKAEAEAKKPSDEETSAASDQAKKESYPAKAAAHPKSPAKSPGGSEAKPHASSTKTPVKPQAAVRSSASPLLSASKIPAPTDFVALAPHH